jgi:hypothetical protein
MKTTIKTFLLLLLISSSGSVFAQPCLQISKQIDACRATMEKNRINISKWEAEIRRNPRRRLSIQPSMNNAINEMNVFKARKANLQKDYKKCLAENNLAKTKYQNQAKSSKTKTNYDDTRRLQKSESDEVIAATKIKMEQNKKIKQNNKVDKLVDETMGTTTIAKKKVEYTATEKLAKQKMKKEEAAKQKNIKSANTIKASESKEVIASTKAKMAENAKIKKGNATGKAVDDLHGDGNFVPKQKIQLTEAEKIAKAKIKQDNRNAESRALNESAAVKAWKAEFKTTKKHTFEHTLATLQLRSEFEVFIKKVCFGAENIDFYNLLSNNYTTWNLRLIYTNFIMIGSPKEITISSLLRSEIIAEMERLNFKIQKNQDLNVNMIRLLNQAKKIVEVTYLQNSYFVRFSEKMNALANPQKKSRFSK